MSKTEGGAKPSFDDVRRRLHPDQDFIGPRQCVSDHRLAAGLLFSRNDNSRRILRNVPGRWPTIEVGWYRDFSGCVASVEVPVAKKVVEQLVAEGAVEGTPYWGYTDDTELQLSKRGKRRVIEEWLEGAGLLDVFAAGAALNLGSGVFSWD